jgi:hypothetical protein
LCERTHALICDPYFNSIAACGIESRKPARHG